MTRIDTSGNVGMVGGCLTCGSDGIGPRQTFARPVSCQWSLVGPRDCGPLASPLGRGNGVVRLAVLAPRSGESRWPPNSHVARCDDGRQPARETNRWSTGRETTDVAGASLRPESDGVPPIRARHLGPNDRLEWRWREGASRDALACRDSTLKAGAYDGADGGTVRQHEAADWI